MKHKAYVNQHWAWSRNHHIGFKSVTNQIKNNKQGWRQKETEQMNKCKHKQNKKANMQQHAVFFLVFCLFSAFLFVLWSPCFWIACFFLIVLHVVLLVLRVVSFAVCGSLCFALFLFYSNVKPARRSLNGAHKQNHSPRICTFHN